MVVAFAAALAWGKDVTWTGKAGDGLWNTAGNWDGTIANGDVTITLGLPHAKVFLCDLSENEISEIPVTDGKFTYTVGGFEIVSFKVKA